MSIKILFSVTEDEYIWLDDATLEHAPTGARFTKGSWEVGLLTTHLADGGDYDLESVLDLAWQLVERRNARRP